MQPHRWQPTRLLCPQNSPGKNTAVGCHFLFQHMKVKSESEVAQSCQTLCNPMDCSLPGPSIHGIFQAKVVEWVAMSFSTGEIYLPLTPTVLCKKQILFKNHAYIPPTSKGKMTLQSLGFLNVCEMFFF